MQDALVIRARAGARPSWDRPAPARSTRSLGGLPTPGKPARHITPPVERQSQVTGAAVGGHQVGMRAPSLPGGSTVSDNQTIALRAQVVTRDGAAAAGRVVVQAQVAFCRWRRRLAGAGRRRGDEDGKAHVPGAHRDKGSWPRRRGGDWTALRPYGA